MKAVFPWQATAGASFAWRFDGAPYNFAFSEDEDRDDEDIDHRFILVAADVTAVGPTKDGVSLESLMAADPKTAG